MRLQFDIQISYYRKTIEKNVNWGSTSDNVVLMI